MDRPQQYLSARVPPELRNRFKALAATRGRSVQDLLREVVSDYVSREEEAARPLAVGTVIARLRPHRDALRQRGVRHLAVFGSVARGHARPDSDVDLAVDFEPGQAPSLVGLASLRADIAEMLDHPVDLVPWSSMRDTVATAARTEAVDIF